MTKLNKVIEEVENNDVALKSILLRAADENNFLETYIKIIERTFLDYQCGIYKDDPKIAHTIIEEFIYKLINSSKEVSRLLSIR